MIYRMLSSMISTLARRLVMPSRGQRRRACRLRPELREDLLQGDDAWTEGIPIVLNGPRQLPDRGFGLYVVQLKVHGADVGPLTRNRQQRCSRAYAAKPPRKAAQRRSD